MSIEKIFRVNVQRLNLRAQPTTESAVLAKLAAGQAVVRLDDADRAGWWFVFADTPGEGLYVGHVWSAFLTPAFVLLADDPPEPDIQLPPPAMGEADGPVVGDEEPDDSPPREPAGGSLPGDEDPAGEAPSAPVVVWPDGWNPAIPPERRHPGAHGDRRGAWAIDRVIIHITGTHSLPDVIRNFTATGSVASAHYLVCPDGALHQFVAEDRRAFHSGIIQTVKALYARADGSWRQYKRYFGWHRGYPADAIFLDGAGGEVPRSQLPGKAALVMRSQRGEWPDYQYFDRRWGRAAKPVGFLSANHDPNNNSIGIEILSVGAQTARPQEYSDEMYAALGALVGDICRRHHLPVQRETVCGHEDVNPVERWGWDPNQGFDWDRLFLLARAVTMDPAA